VSRIQGFAPVANGRAGILVLGSMPGQASLERREYYAHPRNAFWPVMRSLFESNARTWQEKARLLHSERVALWDVLQACIRPGSLDSAIDRDSIVINDFNRLFGANPGIRHVFFNGAKAEELYRRHVMQTLDADIAALPATRLPSTSPANARLNLEQKTRAWRVILEALQ
jgi:TDG/mug DNA glycosylase family protein